MSHDYGMQDADEENAMKIENQMKWRQKKKRTMLVYEN